PANILARFCSYGASPGLQTSPMQNAPAYAGAFCIYSQDPLQMHCVRRLPDKGCWLWHTSTITISSLRLVTYSQKSRAGSDNSAKRNQAWLRISFVAESGMS